MHTKKFGNTFASVGGLHILYSMISWFVLCPFWLFREQIISVIMLYHDIVTDNNLTTWIVPFAVRIHKLQIEPWNNNWDINHSNKLTFFLFEVLKGDFRFLVTMFFCPIFEGNMKNPVFALQHLLQADQQAEKLFLHSFSWKVECIHCGHKYQDRWDFCISSFYIVVLPYLFKSVYNSWFSSDF